MATRVWRYARPRGADLPTPIREGRPYPSIRFEVREVEADTWEEAKKAIAAQEHHAAVGLRVVEGGQ